MKNRNMLAVCLSSLILSLPLALPVLATSSFVPNNTNFTTLFDFDSTPTDEYTEGYKPGIRLDKIGGAIDQKCIHAASVGYCYDLTIIGNGGYQGKALKFDFLRIGPYQGVSLNCKYGKKTLPGVSDGYTATDFIFWVDATNFADCEIKNEEIYLSLSETDYDKSGNILPDKTSTFSYENGLQGGFWFIEDGNGGWIKQCNDQNNFIQGFYIQKGYKGWVKFPISCFDPQDDDVDGKLDCKKMQSIDLEIQSDKKYIGTSLIFDEFGFLMKSNSSPAKTETTVENKSSDNVTVSNHEVVVSGDIIGTNTNEGGINTGDGGMANESNPSGDNTAADENSLSDSTVTNDKGEFVQAAQATTKDTVLISSTSQHSQSKPNMGIILGIIAVAVILLAAVGFIVYKKKIYKFLK